jgi:hypothetical protein
LLGIRTLVAQHARGVLRVGPTRHQRLDDDLTRGWGGGVTSARCIWARQLRSYADRNGRWFRFLIVARLAVTAAASVGRHRLAPNRTRRPALGGVAQIDLTHVAVAVTAGRVVDALGKLGGWWWLGMRRCLHRRRGRSGGLPSAGTTGLGVWAAEGFQNEHRESGPSESRRSD